MLEDEINEAAPEPMPWCDSCRCYHHSTAVCIKDIPQARRNELVTFVCSSCENEVTVSATPRPFREISRGAMLAYYSEGKKGPTLAGVSDVRAENFECLSCHSTTWRKRVGELS